MWVNLPSSKRWGSKNLNFTQILGRLLKISSSPPPGSWFVRTQIKCHQRTQQAFFFFFELTKKTTSPRFNAYVGIKTGTLNSCRSHHCNHMLAAPLCLLHRVLVKVFSFWNKMFLLKAEALRLQGWAVHVEFKCKVIYHQIIMLFISFQHNTWFKFAFILRIFWWRWATYMTGPY